MSGLDNGETYYFSVFPYSTDGEVNASEANRITVVPNRFTIPNAPSQNNHLTYTGGSQSPTWSGYDENKMTLGGVTAGVDADTYTATFTPEYDYCWSDSSIEVRDVTLMIERAVIAIPSQSGGLTYTGAELTPAWSNYDENKMAIGGKAARTDAGSYAATFTPESNYQWPDGIITARTVLWSINKAACSMSVSPEGLSLTADARNKTITVTRDGDGQITATSSNTGVAIVSVSGTTVTANGVASGSATIAISATAGTNHKALRAYVQSLASADKISAVTYGTTLPKKYCDEMDAKLAVAQEQMEAIVSRLGG